MADISFNNRVAIVTGGGGGLGRTYALALAKRGAKVLVNDTGADIHGAGSNISVADEVVQEIVHNGGTAVANHDSVATAKGGESIVQSALDNFGSVDILINNAGTLQDKSFAKMDEVTWDSILSVHLKGAYCVTRPAFIVIKDKQYGRIINTSSGAGLYGNFGQNNYCAAKMGLIGMMNNIAIEGEKYNIKINAIAPVAASRFTKGILPPEIYAKLKPEFITPLVLYLASEMNQDTKMIFNCAAGWFSRAEMVCAQGICLGDGKSEIEPEEIMENWDKITGFEKAKPLKTVMDSFPYFGHLL
jgi:NAD(P)-dependent dehydrogenase (short-subunit alcohol dehydrogenase family)